MPSVVISGIGGRFPQSGDIDEFFKKLLNKESTVEFHPNKFLDNLNVSTATSKIQSAAKFDQTFFSIHSRIANVLDPLMRIFIEPCYEAIIDAGINPKSLAGSNTAVFTNSCISDDESQGCDERITTNFWLLAHIRCLLANRIAYLLDLKGPSFTIDNSWTGGIEVLRQAVEAIETGRVEMAIIGVSNLLLNPALSVLFEGLNRLSPDDKTRSFDQFANGYVRSEGVIALVLQRSDLCLRSYGEVVHVDSIFYGSLERPFLSFNQNSLLEFFNNFYQRAKIDPNTVEFIEADGSAVKNLDSMELNVLSQIFCKNRKTDLKIGSIKSNIGHCEGASALMSIVKALLTLNTNVIAPNINFETPNPNIHKKMKVVTEATSLDGDLVAVNSFGLAGSVGHVLLRRHSQTKKQIGKKAYPKLILVSGRTEKGIAKAIEKLETMPYDDEYCSLVNQVFKEPINGFFYLGYTLLPAPQKPIHGSLFAQSIKRPIWFVYAGMGSQWPGMGRELMHFRPFREAIEECDKVYKPLGLDIKHIITTDDPTIFNNILNSFVGIVACHIGLTEIMRAVGIEPEGYLGHSLGENGCSYADGGFSIREACMGGYARGIASQNIPLKPGLMVSVGLNYKDLTDLPESVDVACHNSDDNTTISGPKDDVEKYLEKLKKKGIFYRAVNSSFIAYHSRQVIPISSKVLEVFKKAVANPKKRSSKWISSSIPEEEWDTPLAQYCSAEYHVNNLLKPVLFNEACAHIPENAIVIEIAPHGLMQSLLKRTTKDSCVNIPLCKRQTESPANFLLASLGQLYMNGIRPNIEALYEPAQFPVSRGTPCLSPCVSWNHEDDWDVALVNNQANKTKEIDLLDKQYRSLFSHGVHNSLVPPLSLFLVEVYQKLCDNLKNQSDDNIFVCEEYKMETLLTLSPTEPLVIQTEISLGTGSFEQRSSKYMLGLGKAYFIEPNMSLPDQKIDLKKKKNEHRYVIDGETFYDSFRQHNYQLQSPFDGVKQLNFYSDVCHAEVVYNGNLMVYLDTIMKIKIFIEMNDDQVPKFPKLLKNCMISSAAISKLNPGDRVDVIVDLATDEITAPGVYMSKLSCDSFEYECKVEDDIKLSSVNFIPHFTSLQKNVGTKKFLYCLIQLMIDNLSVKKKDAHLTLVTINNCFPIDIVKHIQSKLSVAGQVDVISSHNAALYCDLLLCSYQTVKEAAHLNATFLLVSCSPGDDIDPSLNIVAHYQFKEEGLMLIRNKTKPMKYTVIRTQSTPQWKKCLKTKDTPLLIWENPNVNVQSTMKQINAMGHPVVCIFLLDMKAPAFSLDESFYQQQLRKQLKVNVFKNGEWGGYYYENVNPVPETKYPIIMPEFFGSAKYLGLNLKDNTTNIDFEEKKCELGHIEFSGMIEGGGKIMGLAQYDSDSCTILPDPDLTWNVPPEWNLQDAVTIPFAYTTVYHALASKLSSKVPTKRASMLIHAGHTIVGQAAINFALSRGFNVFTTVPDTKQYAPALKQQFPKLQNSNIFSLSDSNFEIEILLATNGQGVNFVFSSVCGDQFYASQRCTSSFGNFIQVGAADMHKNKEMGLNLFLRSVEMFSVAENDVYSLSKENKRELRTMIENDINEGLIFPFKRKIFDNNQTHEAMRALEVDSLETKIVLSLTRNPNSDSLFTCLSNRTYLVTVSSSIKPYNWLNIIRWLLKRSARRIIIGFDSNIHNDYIDRRLNNMLNKYKDAVFIFLPMNVLNTKNGVVNAMKHMVQNKLTALDAVFTIGLDEKRLENLDLALREVAPNLPVFLCLESCAEQLCEVRRNLNMPSLCVQSSSQKDLVRYLDTLSLECNAMTTSPLVILQPRQSENFISPNIFHEIFPLSIDELLLISKDISMSQDNYSFTQVRTKSPGLNYSNEILPVFFISSLCSSYLQSLFDQILYPAFCSQLPVNITSIQDYAKGLCRNLKNIQHNAPYTIVGEIWSSCVVFEIAKILEKGGDKVTVILLEGLPDTVTTSMQDIVDLHSPTVDIELLGDLVQVENNVSLNKSWDENMEQILSSIDDLSKELCKLTLESLTTRIILSSKYAQSHQQTGDKLKSTIVYMCFSHTPILLTYTAFEKYHSGELILKVSETSSYLKLVEHKSTADVINDYANYPL